MKQELKELARKIKELKATRGPANNGRPGGLSTYQYQYRHKHIAFCMFRGTPYEAIENKVAEGNEPNWGYIDEITKTLHPCIKEAV